MIVVRCSGCARTGLEFPVEASISKFEIGGERVLTVRLRDITERKYARGTDQEFAA